MKQRVKKKWLQALRSGKYVQADGSLRENADSFCCLGVLCDLYAKEHGKRWKFDARYSFGGEEAYPPSDVLTWAGLDNKKGGSVVIGNKRRQLANHNDNGASFEDIADAIECQL